MKIYNKKVRKTVYVIIALLIISITALMVAAVYYVLKIDYGFDEELFTSVKYRGNTRIYYNSADGGEYAPKLYEEAIGSDYRKIWTPYSDISDALKNTFISMEDREFFEHGGINIKRTVAAAANHIFHFKPSFGGSTITQQVVKNISGDSERTVSRKINEIFRSVHLEGEYSKEEIFEVYLNVVSMGENIIGVGEASEEYFGKEASEISYEEAAVLVGIANAPGRYHPRKHKEACMEKRNKVLFSLLECGHIDKEYYEAALQKDLGVIERVNEKSASNSWFTETVVNDVASDIAKERGISKSVAVKYVLNGGVKIYSTVSPKIQKIMEEYFENEENFPIGIKDGLQYSMVVSDPKSGNLLGIIGSVGKKNANRILNYADVNITPGSTLKPLALYAPLLDIGKINWATVFDDVPLEFSKNEDGSYTMYPQNSPAVYDGLITIKDALRVSKNTVALRLYNMLGAERIYFNLKNNFGFDTLIKKKLREGGIITDLAPSPLGLGQLSEGVSLRKITEAYNVFPGGGELHIGRSYIAVYDSENNLIIENKDSCKSVFKPETAAIMNKLLSEVVDSGTAKKITLSEITDTAGKTGTSGNDRDRLFIGYTPNLCAGIWCGFSGEKREISKQSVSHLEIWDAVMKRIVDMYDEESEAHFSESGIERLPYCKDSGKLYSDVCMYDVRGSRMEYGYFVNSNKPEGICKTHCLFEYDFLTEGIATHNCDEENLEHIALISVESRSFPCEVIISDAEFVCRKLKSDTKLPNDYKLPYFYYTIPEGEYVGRSKGKKQFNSLCYLHND